jgi:hypothetical protein
MFEKIIWLKRDQQHIETNNKEKRRRGIVYLHDIHIDDDPDITTTQKEKEITI